MAARQAAFRLFDAFSRRERMIEERGLMATPAGARATSP